MPSESNEREIQVIAYSGYRPNERPLHFLMGDHRLQVKEILDRWYGEDHDHFKLLADNGRIYWLKWHRSSDNWFVTKIAEGPGAP